MILMSELVLAADKVLNAGDFNIHVDNEKICISISILRHSDSIGVRQHVFRTYSLLKSYFRFNTVTMELMLMGLKFCSKVMIYQITI